MLNLGFKLTDVLSFCWLKTRVTAVITLFYFFIY